MIIPAALVALLGLAFSTFSCSVLLLLGDEFVIQLMAWAVVAMGVGQYNTVFGFGSTCPCSSDHVVESVDAGPGCALCCCGSPPGGRYRLPARKGLSCGQLASGRCARSNRSLGLW